MRVAARGGEPEVLTRPIAKAESSITPILAASRWAGGAVLRYWPRRPGSCPRSCGPRPADRPATDRPSEAVTGQYVASGHLVYAAGGASGPYASISRRSGPSAILLPLIQQVLTIGAAAFHRIERRHARVFPDRRDMLGHSCGSRVTAPSRRSRAAATFRAGASFAGWQTDRSADQGRPTSDLDLGFLARQLVDALHVRSEPAISAYLDS